METMEWCKVKITKAYPEKSNSKVTLVPDTD